MNNNTNDKLDAMLQQYYGREQESFEYNEAPKKRSPLRYTSAVAAVFAILLCAGLLLYTCITPKNDLVINVAAQGTEEYTDLSVKTFYKATFDLDYAGITDKSEMLTAGIIVVKGDNIADIQVDSLYDEGEFLMPYGHNYFQCLDSDGNMKPHYGTDSRLVLICSEEEFTEDEKTSSIWYVPVDENGEPISNNEYIAEEKADTVQMKIYFEDGSCNTKHIFITYNEGKMNIKAE
ncbi:MAG: hypothetical protein IJ298_11445 [Ruminococcus sp.]|nr:hypothetical protein [Ruminococcus sp.]